ncbi:MAG: hypothetical protein GXP25_03045 [Planctomycetes bacterium]|nr:hypothetical protein [Planctomycetota bacterium]
MTEDQNAKPKRKASYSKRRRTVLMVLLGGVILLSGIVIGSGLTLLWLQNKLLYMLHHPEDAPNAIALRLQSKLDLTDEQTKQVEAILRERQKHSQALRREVQPRVEEQLAKARDEVAKVLTPEQAKRWHAYFDSMQKKWLPPAPPAPPEAEKGKGS